jgi:hypothetical protein
VDLELQAVEQLARGGRIDLEQPADVLEVDRDPDQLLLWTVVQLALDPAAIGIGGQREPLARRTQLLDLEAQLPDRLLQFLDPSIVQRDRLLPTAGTAPPPSSGAR